MAGPLSLSLFIRCFRSSTRSLLITRVHVHDMLNRTAGSLGRNAGPVSPALLKLEPEQRMRFVWSSHKVSQVLGATPVVDITPPSVSTSTPLTTPVSTRNLKHPPSFLAQHSPVTFIHSFTSKASARDDTIKSPALHYTINIAEENTVQPVTATRRRSNKLRRRNAPTALYLGQAQRTEALPLSPFRYALLKWVSSVSSAPAPTRYTKNDHVSGPPTQHPLHLYPPSHRSRQSRKHKSSAPSSRSWTS